MCNLIHLLVTDFFFFSNTSTTNIYTLSLHDALPIFERRPELISWRHGRCLPYGEGITFWALGEMVKAQVGILEGEDRKSTRLNSSHRTISYAVFCLKKKKSSLKYT